MNEQPDAPMPEEPEDIDALAARLIAQAEAHLAARAGDSRYTVKVSRWEISLYRDMRTSHRPLAQVAAGFEDDVDYAEDLLVDVYAYLWLANPQRLARREVMVSRWRNAQVLAAMAASTEVAELRSATVHDDVAAAMAVVWLSESIRAWLKAQPEPEETPDPVEAALEAVQQSLDTLDRADLDDALEALAAALDGDDDGEGGNIEGLDTAARDASIEFDELTALGGLVGLSQRGNAVGEGRGMGTAATWELLRRLRNTQVSRYADLIGRMVTVAATGTSRSLYPRGVELSDRLFDADAAELATRRHPLLRLEHLERVAAGELVTEAWTGKPEVAGPMVICVDESSSMEGKNAGVSRMVWAKAFTLAMVQQARTGRRKVVVISFSSPKQMRVWENVATDTEELVSFLEHDFYGGTAYEEPLDAALTVVERYPGMSAADIVLVTDDDRVDVPAGWLTRWRKRRDKVKPVPPKLRGVCVSVAPGRWLTKVADDVVQITDFTSEQQVMRATRRL